MSNKQFKQLRENRSLKRYTTKSYIRYTFSAVKIFNISPYQYDIMMGW